MTIIRQNNGVNVDEIAKEMQLAPATVRRHLDILERDGLVDHSEVRKPTGRPQYSFHLTEKGHDSVPKDYSRLLNELVFELKNIPANELSSRSGGDVLRDSLTLIGEKRAVQYRQGRGPVEAVTAAFEEGGYDPIVQTSEEGLKIRVTNCPYRRASIDDEIICTVDRSMVTSLLGKDIEHSVEMSPESNECVYTLAATHLVKIDSTALGS
ncbi:MAG: MarR family transcriptional regulator [Chloroflexi bacterium]|nr:MarR family transcriptional regulator [Chloroflexota bacterium]